MSFPHLPVTSMLDVTRNLEVMRSEGQQGLEIPVIDLRDVTTNMEQIATDRGISLPHLPVRSLTDVTENFEALNG